MRKFYLSLLTGLFITGMNAQTKKIAFIGQADVYSSNIPTASDGLTYDDDRAAAVWFMDTFVPAHSSELSGTYLSFQDVAEGANLSDFDVIWIQSDGATYTERLNEWPRGTTEGNGDKHCILSEAGFQWNGQCSALEDDFMSKIKTFYKSGKKILLGNYAGKGLEVFGVFDGLSSPWEYRPNQLFGDTTANPDNTPGVWGTNWSSNTVPVLTTGIATNPVGCSFSSQSIEFLGAGTAKKNRALQYNLNWGRIYDDAGGATSTMAQRRQAFQTTLNAEILLENCDGNEIQAAKFNPRNAGDGTVIWYGAGVYDWYAPGGSNQNVKKITENTLLYLAGSSTLFSTQDLREKRVSVYPNPVTSTLNISVKENVESTIFDATGRKILTSSAKTIDVDKLTPGTYTMQIRSGKEAQTVKFIKK
ncbi:MAG: hypothetical protein BGO40_05395 [Chryseobacterium sp. 39-10]|nr:DUF4960 domain-containing protein [Chryseobacterium sp.]OJV47895.1 MAG: hypothetical protein BGO40_05395 [Chryseobacterium sp. 39-10]